MLIFETSIGATGGDDSTKAKAFIMVATGIARAWYTTLALGSIESWEQLRDLIISEFQGNQTRAATLGAFEITSRGSTISGVKQEGLARKR